MNNKIQEKPENLDELMEKLKKQASFSFIDVYIKKILLTLLVYGEMNLYQIHKATGLAHATVHKKIKEAEKEGFITIKSTSKFRTGLSSKTYDFTPFGFQFILSIIEKEALLEHPQLLQQLERRARENPEFAPAFEWWDVFMREDRLVQLLYLEYFLFFEADFPDFVIAALWEPEPFQKTPENIRIFRLAVTSEHQEQLEKEEEREQLKSKLFSLLQKNEKLRTVVLKRLCYLQEYYNSWVKNFEKLEQKIKNQCV